MASDRKIAANRKNALRSTGPRSAAGKTRVSRNAVRHGLSAPIADLPVSAEMDRLARKLAGEFATPQRLEQARIAAEAEFEILRVRAHRKTHIDLNAANSRAERWRRCQKWQPWNATNFERFRGANVRYGG